MRAIRMTAKRAGTCTDCGQAINPGQTIHWARGAGARHADCRSAEYAASCCSACSGRGSTWNGRPCGSCDGTGAKRVQEFARAGGHRPDPVDLAYEDDCARRCGL
jgi:hypothetical protein